MRHLHLKRPPLNAPSQHPLSTPLLDPPRSCRRTFTIRRWTKVTKSTKVTKATMTATVGRRAHPIVGQQRSRVAEH
eukprot:7418170-Pyramimonas_sp.AAC.1